MATCGSLSSLFDKPKLPENPTLMESLSAWNQIMPKKPLDSPSFTEIFGELHFHEKCADPLQLCTEGLGSESCGAGAGADELQVIENDGSISEEVLTEDCDQYRCVVRPRNVLSRSFSDVRSRITGGFPPPISSINSRGKPWTCLESYRQDGRFVLREVRVPTKEFLHASREDGRLKLQLVQRDEGVPEGEDDDDVEVEVGIDAEEGQKEEEEMEAAKVTTTEPNTCYIGCKIDHCLP